MSGRELAIVGLPPLRFDDVERPECDVIGGAVLTGEPVDGRFRDDHRTAGDDDACGFIALEWVGKALDHGHRRKWAQIPGMDDVEERLDDLGEVVVDAAMHARGHEGESFEEALDVRVGRGVFVEKEAAGYARILARELSAHLAKIGKFAFVVFEQLFAHAPTLPRTPRW